MNALGTQVAVELYECAGALDDIPAIKDAMLEAAAKGRATVVGECFHQYSPHGVTGVLVIAESHIAIHTWPEYRYAALDIFTCGNTVDPFAIKESLEKALAAGRTSVMEMKRGLIQEPIPEKYPAEQTNEEKT